MSRAVNKSRRQALTLAKGQGLRWLRKNRVDLATAASILLSVLVGLVGNLVAGSWSWASLAMLVVLAISLAGLEVLRHRLGKHETPQRRDNASGSSSTGAVAIENQHGITGDWVVAVAAVKPKFDVVMGTAVSRRGLVPRAHAEHGIAPVTLEEVPLGSLKRLWRWLLNRGATVGWRAAVDSLRPHSQLLWQSLSASEKRRFLRHARPWWDVLARRQRLCLA